MSVGRPPFLFAHWTAIGGGARASRVGLTVLCSLLLVAFAFTFAEAHLLAALRADLLLLFLVFRHLVLTSLLMGCHLALQFAFLRGHRRRRLPWLWGCLRRLRLPHLRRWQRQRFPAISPGGIVEGIRAGFAPIVPVHPGGDGPPRQRNAVHYIIPQGFGVAAILIELVGEVGDSLRNDRPDLRADHLHRVLLRQSPRRLRSPQNGILLERLHAGLDRRSRDGFARLVALRQFNDSSPDRRENADGGESANLVPFTANQNGTGPFRLIGIREAGYDAPTCPNRPDRHQCPPDALAPQCFHESLLRRRVKRLALQPVPGEADAFNGTADGVVHEARGDVAADL